MRWHPTVKLHPLTTILSALALVLGVSGCSLFPEARQRDRIHNPFPQLKRVAVLPFFNQSSEPTVDGEMVAEKYYAALQAIPGFEVLPIGVTKAQWLQYARTHGEPSSGRDFQRLAQHLGVEAIVVGSVTDFEAYYPPRMAMTVHWYAANEGFHPIPAGYGLPWGTENEKQIPQRIVRDAEFELARSQLATQTPVLGNSLRDGPTGALSPTSGSELQLTPVPAASGFEGTIIDGNVVDGPLAGGQFHDAAIVFDSDEADLPMPLDWPDPTDLIPDPPSAERPLATINHEPILTHTRLYRGDDPYVTNRLSDHVETGDDARPGGWQGYLKRSDDFVHFCCHLHITEMLESRGGSDQSDLILRWPLSRY